MNALDGTNLVNLTNTAGINDEYPSWLAVRNRVEVSPQAGTLVSFSNVTTAGNTVAMPIDPASAGVLPEGFRMLVEPIVFDVRTSANYTGDIEICFDVPNVNDPKLFAELVVFHNEGGALVDRTTSRDFDARRICATVTSLSPFVVAAPDAPTAASVTIAGRILTKAENGLANANVLMTDAFGNTRSARTNSFGYYSFEEVEVGQTYIFNASSRRYRFAPRVVSVIEEINNLNFYAGQ